MSQQQPPPSAPGTVSPDGQYVWDGSQWAPNPNLAKPPAPKSGHMVRNLGVGCLGLIVLIVIIAVAGGAGKKSTSTPAVADKSPAAGASKAPAAAAQLLTLDGTGTKSTQKFTAGGDWDLHYTYDCAAFGQACNFIVTIKNGDGSVQFDNQGVSQSGLKGEDTQHYHKGGTYFLEIISEGSWHIDVKG